VKSESLELILSHLLPASSRVSLREISVGDLLRAAASAVSDRPAVIRVPSAESALESVWTYRELLERSEDVAHRLLADFRPGDHIGVWATNKPEWVLLQLAAALSGLVLVTLNPANRIEEMRYLLKQSKACGLFLDRAFRKLDNESMLAELLPDLPSLRTVVFLDEWEHYLAGPRSSEALPVVQPDSAALILFTSGTTGKPKGVVLSHRGVVNNARCALERYELKQGAVWLSVLPFFHVGGSVTNTLTCIANQGTHAVMSEFNPEIMLRSIEKYRANITMGVPVMVHAMLEHERFATTDLSSLELLLTGGTTVAPALVKVIREQFNTDVAVTFGQTEAGGSMCVSRRGDSEDLLCNTVGTPIASYEMKIIGTVDGQVVPVGQVGEICVRSPSTMTEYFDMPEQTAQTQDAEGWIHTGDLGIMRSDGYISIAGRLKDMVIRGGENIYPREVEDTLMGHPAVAQTAVFGVPDEKWGEQLAAAVILKPGEAVTGEQLAAFLGTRIARHKTPKYWSFVTSFPTNPTGKIQKFVLREQFLTSHAVSSGS
jgi:fatty-acyl-CoA synthase